METLNAYCGYTLAILVVLVPLIGAIPNLKINQPIGISWRNLTVWGKCFVILSAMLLISGIAKVFLDKEVQRKNDSLQAQMSVKREAHQDSLFKALAAAGLTLNENSNSINIANLNRFLSNFSVVPKSIDDTVRKAYRADTIIEPSTTVSGQTTPVSERKRRDYTDDELQIPDTDLGAEGKRYSNGENFTALARCKFINHTSYPITLYYGDQTTISSPIRGTNSASVGRSIVTGFGEIGYNRPNGTVNPPSAYYNFYFITSTSPKLYGKITVKLSAFKETTKVLDDQNLVLTASGARERYSLEDAKLN